MTNNDISHDSHFAFLLIGNKTINIIVHDH